MFAFSPSQKQFTKEGLINNFRVDGRKINQRRLIDIKCNILDNLSGSSYVSIDHGKIEIYTGIKIKVASCTEGEKPKNTVILQISSMRKLTTELNDCLVYLQQLLQQHFINKENKAFSQLQIPNSKKHYLQMHIQTFLLCQPHLNLFQSLFVSIQKALESTSIPKIECFVNEVTNEESVEIGQECHSINLSSVDTILLVGFIEGKCILDLTTLQFESVSAVYLLSIKNEKITAIESIKGAIGADQIHKICRFGINNSK